jgi:glycine cleavage system H protein
MQDPKGYRYTREHEWVSIEGTNKGRVGLTGYAQEMLGDIVYVKLPAVGTSVKRSKKMGEVESVKAVSPIYSPISGEVMAINKKIKAAPQVVNRDPYGEGWLVQLKAADEKEALRLMDSRAYAKYVSTLSKQQVSGHE